MKIDKRCFWNGAIGAMAAILTLFSVKSCGSGVVEAIENRSVRSVCSEVLKSGSK